MMFRRKEEENKGQMLIDALLSMFQNSTPRSRQCCGIFQSQPDFHLLHIVLLFQDILGLFWIVLALQLKRRHYLVTSAYQFSGQRRSRSLRMTPSYTTFPIRIFVEGLGTNDPFSIFVFEPLCETPWTARVPQDSACCPPSWVRRSDVRNEIKT